MPTDAEIIARLAALGHALPATGPSAFAFLPWRREGDLVFLAGQICQRDGRPGPVGAYGREVDLASARAGALSIGLQLLSHLRAALDGDLGRVRQAVMVRGFVAAAPDHGDYPAVIDACSELFIALWGEAGRHARTSIGVALLPFGATVEIDAIFAVD